MSARRSWLCRTRPFSVFVATVASIGLLTGSPNGTQGQGAGQGGAQPKAKGAQGPAIRFKDQDDPTVKAAVAKAIAWIRAAAFDPNRNIPVAESAAMLQALAKSELAYRGTVKPDDPAVRKCYERVSAVCQGTFKPSHGPFTGPDLYESGLVIMGLAACDAAFGTTSANEIKSVVDHILASQKANGSWGYSGREGEQGDNSMMQYCLLGLWEASASAGVNVPLAIFDRAVAYIISTQNSTGGFVYHPPHGEVTHTMTAAGIGSVGICRDQLPGGKRKPTRLGGVLKQVAEEERVSFKAATANQNMKQSIERALGWISANWRVEHNEWQFYYLYAIERMATLAIEELGGNGRVIGNSDWYSDCAEFILSKQRPDGSWHAGGGVPQEIDTAYCVLFLVRSTSVSKKVHERKLGRATLISNEGLPSDLRELERVKEELKSAAIRGDKRQLLKILETNPDAAAQTAETVFADLFKKKGTSLGEKIELARQMLENGYKTKNEKLINQGLRSLAQTGDYRVVPMLIDGLYFDAIPQVQISAQQALCLISRKFTGFGIKESYNTDEWKEEIANWEAWYRAVRPQAELDDEYNISPSAAATASTATGPTAAGTSPPAPASSK